MKTLCVCYSPCVPYLWSLTILDNLSNIALAALFIYGMLFFLSGWILRRVLSALCWPDLPLLRYQVKMPFQVKLHRDCCCLSLSSFAVTPAEEAKAPIPDAPEAMDQPADASAVAPPDASSEEPPAGGNDDTASATDTEVSVNADNLDESLDRLDLLLTYVWRVHGVDYYAGYELTPTEFGQRLVGTR